jgi:hypothetical protein
VLAKTIPCLRNEHEWCVNRPDPCTCVQTIASHLAARDAEIAALRKEREDGGYWMNKCEEALKRSGENKARADAADAEIATLREALEPFAKFADVLNEQMPDDLSLGFYCDGGMNFGPGCARLSDLRSARAALARKTAQ